MENLKELFAKRLQKIENLEDAIDILSEKPHVFNELQILRDISVDIKILSTDVKKIISETKSNQQKRYVDVMNGLRKKQIIMMNLLTEIDKCGNPPPLISLPVDKLSPKVKTDNCSLLSTISNQKNYNKMSLAEFKKSPFITKIKPVSLHFLDFETEITQNQFNTIPSYMRGRDSVTELNQFLETVIIKCFNEKYSLLYKKRDAVKNADTNLWSMYRSQMNYFPDMKFITQGDISRCMDRLIDKKTNNRITMLRHLRVLKESRKFGAICYLWNL